jgi:hypothetical protein
MSLQAKDLKKIEETLAHNLNLIKGFSLIKFLFIFLV